MSPAAKVEAKPVTDNFDVTQTCTAEGGQHLKNAGNVSHNAQALLGRYISLDVLACGKVSARNWSQVEQRLPPSLR